MPKHTRKDKLRIVSGTADLLDKLRNVLTMRMETIEKELGETELAETLTSTLYSVIEAIDEAKTTLADLELTLREQTTTWREWEEEEEEKPRKRKTIREYPGDIEEEEEEDFF